MERQFGENYKDFIRGKMVFWAIILLVFSHGFASGGRKTDIELQRELKQLNKPAVKTIKSEDGDIIDCVDIHKQPAFDHSSLKNHTIQVRPTSFPAGFEETVSSVESVETLQLWHKNGECPEGTIPIRRTQKRDILEATALKNSGKKYSQIIDHRNFTDYSDNQLGHEHALVYLNGSKYYGTKAILNVWNPTVDSPREFSLAHIRLLSIEPGNFNSIEVGWMVHPQLLGDYRTRLYTYWTRDNHQETGCYNLQCSGFVQIDKDIALGTTLQPISSYGGHQFQITLLVFKDPKSGNWWLSFQDKALGYWPSFLFTGLADSANVVEWGGEIINSQPDGHHTSTQMGSGHFPNEGFKKSSYIKNIQIVDKSNTLHDTSGLKTIAKQANCYDVQLSENTGSIWDTYIYFGGPGKNPNCP